MRQQSRSFALHNPALTHSPNSSGFAEIVGDDFPVLHLTSSVLLSVNALVELYWFFGVGEATSF
jgi:hypothetical protein